MLASYFLQVLYHTLDVFSSTNVASSATPFCLHAENRLQVRDLSPTGAPSGVWKISIRLGSPAAREINASSAVRDPDQVDKELFVVSTVEFTHGIINLPTMMFKELISWLWLRSFIVELT